MTDLTRLSLKALRDGLAAKQFSAREATDAYVSAIEAGNDKLNAYVAVTADKAREMAKASDEKIASGDNGKLEGVPLGIKDLFATRGVHTQAASHILDGFKPEYESTVTSNLWRDGAVMLGKLNMDEFAMGSSNETSYYGPVVNPWRAEGGNKDLVPGGSSGGSASAVAAWLCAGATATDTGGSIRQPAAFTGTVGIKPTYGRCSRWGTVAFASSLDQAGPIARTVEDSALMLQSMAGYDPNDSTSVDMAVPDVAAAVERARKGSRSVFQPNIAWTVCLRKSKPSGARAWSGSRRRARASRTFPCRIPNMPCRPIISWPPPKRLRTWRAMTASSTGCA